MKSVTNILLATEENGFADKVNAYLGTNENVKLSGVCRGLTELEASLESSPVPVAVIDIDKDTQATLRELDKIVPKFPRTRFAVVSSISNKDLILESMHSGARHFLHKKFIEPELDRILERVLLSDDKLKAAKGSIISVFSASGGCGSTTVVLNLANELRLISGDAVLAIDLDACYGSVSNYLGIKGKYGIADLLERRETIDENLIVSSAANYKKDFHVLKSPASDGHLGLKLTQSKKLHEALEACKKSYKYTLIDSARVSDETAKLLVKTSRMIVIVFQLTVKDIKTAKSILATLTQLGTKPDKIVLLANRYRKRGPMVPLPETKKVLGTDNLYLIRNDFRSIIDSLNRAVPLAEAAPRSKIRKDFSSLAEIIFSKTKNGQV